MRMDITARNIVSTALRLLRRNDMSIQSLFRLSLLSLATPILLHAQTVSPSALQPIGQLQQIQQGATSARGTSVPDVRSAPSVAPEDVSKMKLMPGSMVDIHVFEEPDLDGAYRLDDHGNIGLPLAGSIHLESMTLRQAEDAVGAKLVTAQILNAPHVVINLDEYSAQNIVVMGEVNSPGRYPVLGPRKLMDVLTMAGGQTALAGSEIVVYRVGQPPETTQVIHYGRDVNDPAALNVAIDPGDTVLVKRAGIVYVLGAVNRPGGYVMQEAGQLNVAQVLALAMGTAPEAKVGSIRVIRKLPDGSLLEAQVDYKKFNKGEVAPLSLKPEDIVYVPPSAAKNLLIRGTNVLSAAASATIYTVR